MGVRQLSLNWVVLGASSLMLVFATAGVMRL